MEDWLIPYTAGLFDGEGSVGIRRKPPQVHNTKSPFPKYLMLCYLSMVEREAIDLLHERWGGYIAYRIPNQPNRRNNYQWNIQAKRL